MEITNRKPNQASTQLAKQSESSTREAQIVMELTKLGIRRQAKLGTADYLVLAADLACFEDGDILAGLDWLGRNRGEFETAFPALDVMEGAIRKSKAKRRESEAMQAGHDAELAEEAHRKAHPEEYVAARDAWAEILYKFNAKWRKL